MKLVVGIWLCLGVFSAQAAPPQTVYRCGPEGRVYSQTPCADGKPINTEDRRTATQRKQAREAAAKDAQMADQLADERRKREEAAKAQKVQGFKAPEPEPTASAPVRKKTSAKPTDPNMSPPMRLPPAASK